jgi:formate/nitrite transporter
VQLENRYKGLRAPHKIKLAVSGCTRECAEAQGKDVGVIATDKGWNLYVCGNGGMKPRHADLLRHRPDRREPALPLIDRFLMFYVRTADRLQRTSTWRENLEGGLDYLKAVLIEDSLGIGAELEAQMQHVVDTYQCEWKTAVTMAYLNPAEFVTKMVDSGESKLLMSTRDTLIRSYMAGAILALAAAFAVTVTVNTGNPLIGAMLFPVGFIMLYLMGFDLLTGVFTLAPLAVMDKRPGATWGGVMRNWGLVFCGNFAGALTVAVFMAIILTFGFSEAPGAVGEKLGHIGEGRTLGYSAHGAAGMLTLFVRAVMCNWMVSTGVVAAMMSTTVSGKAIGMWMPVMVFFYMGFEHSIVNMFLFPTGLMLGGNFTLMDYLIWNELPTVLGNLVGGLTFVGATLYSTHYKTAPKRKVS